MNKNKFSVKDFITKEDLPMFSSGARFTLGAVLYLENRHETTATFDLFVRELPSKRNYLVFAGLEHVLSFLLNYKLQKEHLDYFKKYFNFDKKTLDFYKNLKFTGDICAMPEGTIAFPNEPLIRITAPIVQCMIIEQYLINTVMLQTMLASKISRLMTAANKKKVGLTFVRTHGIDSAMKSVRCGKIVGLQLAALPLATMKYDDMPGSHSSMTCHYFISFFRSEREAFRAYIKYFPMGGDMLIDTYDTTKGLDNLIKVLKETNKTVKSVMLDSGNVLKLSKEVRKKLDDNGFGNIKIFAAGNLDEYKVKKMEANGSKIDIYAAVTEVINSPDAPFLETVYKLSEVQEGQKIIPKMKLSKDKVTLPGKKQVFRIEKNNKYIQDIIGLDNENVKGKKILVPYVKNGKLIKKLPSIPEINKHYEYEKNKFNSVLFSINRKVKYKTQISGGLKKLIKETKRDIKKNI